MKVLVLGARMDFAARIEDKLRGISDDVEAKILVTGEESSHPDLIAIPNIMGLLIRGEHDIVLLEDGEEAKACLAEICKRGFDSIPVVIVGDWLLKKDTIIAPYYVYTSDVYLAKGATAVLSLQNSFLYWRQTLRMIQTIIKVSK